MADVDTVRVLADVTSTDWPDPAVQALLDADGGAVKLAAADILEVLAGRLTDVESDQIKLSGSRQAATLLARAKALRVQFYEQDGGSFYFDSASVVDDCFRHLGTGYTDYQWGYTADEVI